MRAIDIPPTFKRDYKRVTKGRYRSTLDSRLKRTLLVLVSDIVLEPRYRDYDLSGNWAGYRECSIKPNLLLIYRKLNSGTLQLVRLGSRVELYTL